MYIQRSRIKSGIFLEWSCLFLNVLEPPCGDFNILSRMLLRILGSKMHDSGLLASLLKTYYFPYVVVYNNLRKYLYFLPSIYWLPFCPSWLPSVHHDWLLFPVLELFCCCFNHFTLLMNQMLIQNWLFGTKCTRRRPFFFSWYDRHTWHTHLY